MCIIALRNVYNRRLSPNSLLLFLFFCFCGWPFILSAFKGRCFFFFKKGNTTRISDFNCWVRKINATTRRKHKAADEFHTHLVLSWFSIKIEKRSQFFKLFLFRKAFVRSALWLYTRSLFYIQNVKESYYPVVWGLPCHGLLHRRASSFIANKKRATKMVWSKLGKKKRKKRLHDTAVATRHTHTHTQLDYRTCACCV